MDQLLQSIKNQDSENEIVELDEEFIVLAIPDNTVEVDITAKIYIDHELKAVTKHMDFQEVREAIREARDGYIPSNAVFSLAPLGEEKIKEIVKRYRDGIDNDA